MTSFFERKVVGDNYYDRCVIVDNSVEIGDFSYFMDFLGKNYSLFFSE